MLVYLEGQGSREGRRGMGPWEVPSLGCATLGKWLVAPTLHGHGYVQKWNDIS